MWRIHLRRRVWGDTEVWRFLVKQCTWFPFPHGRPALREDHTRGMSVWAPTEGVNRSKNCRTAGLGLEGQETLTKWKGGRISHIEGSFQNSPCCPTTPSLTWPPSHFSVRNPELPYHLSGHLVFGRVGPPAPPNSSLPPPLVLAEEALNQSSPELDFWRLPAPEASVYLAHQMNLSWMEILEKQGKDRPNSWIHILGSTWKTCFLGIYYKVSAPWSLPFLGTSKHTAWVAVIFLSSKIKKAKGERHRNKKLTV